MVQVKALRSMTGIVRRRPGSSFLSNLPSRSMSIVSPVPTILIDDAAAATTTAVV